jgi:hypothetical protein
MDTLLSSIELRRGTTLKLECACLAAVRLVDGASLVYALEDASLSIEAAEGCSIELRRRGEVAPRPRR